MGEGGSRLLIMRNTVMWHAANQGSFTSLYALLRHAACSVPHALCAAIAQVCTPNYCSDANEAHTNHNCLCTENVLSLPCEHDNQKHCAVYTVQLVYISRRLACISTKVPTDCLSIESTVTDLQVRLWDKRHLSIRTFCQIQEARIFLKGKPIHNICIKYKSYNVQGNCKEEAEV